MFIELFPFFLPISYSETNLKPYNFILKEYSSPLVHPVKGPLRESYLKLSIHKLFAE